MDRLHQNPDETLDPRTELGTPLLRDLVLTVAATGAALVVMFASREVGTREPDALGIGLVVLAGTALMLRRRWPAAVLVFVVAVTWVVLVLDLPGGTELPLVMAALFSAMAEGRRATALSLLGLIVLGSVGYRVFVDRDDPLLVVATVSLLVLVVLLGEGTRARRALRAEVRERLRVMEADKDRETQARLTAERLQIARELHDVLAHTITAITVQAGAAADGPELDDRSRASLRSMRTTAREAMHQLQATIEVLRSEHDDRPALAAPGLSNLDALVRGVEETGLDVEVSIDEAARLLPAAVELTAYRIVQEALTNVIRHADAESAAVSISCAAEAVIVTVIDDGVGAAASGGTGYGILGMRERAQALGGSLSAGPDEAGGFRVVARLPIGKEAP